MSANTVYTVEVIKSVKETIEVSAVTEEEAREEAQRLPDVMFVKSVRWKEWDEN